MKFNFFHNLFFTLKKITVEMSMKRIIIIYVIIVFLSFGLSCKKDENSVKVVALNGIINFLNGDVTFIMKDGSALKAKISDEVKESMTIRTIGEKSFVDVYFGENVIKVLGNTTVKFKKLVSNIDAKTEEYNFFIEKG